MLIWLRSETRDNETRTPLTPDGAAALIAKGWRVVVEDDDHRCIYTKDYTDVGCDIAPAGSWIDAPRDAIILGLKELPDDGTHLSHRHIMFGHAFKGQGSARGLLDRFKVGDGTLLDLEYLVDGTGRRVAAFGYWAGFAGAALSVVAWTQQQNDKILGQVETFPSAVDMIKAATGETKPGVLIIGAKGRVGNGAADLCKAVGATPTLWDMEETAHGGPFPEVLEYDILLNCILAHEGAPVFVEKDAGEVDRKLSVIGDIACDPDSAYSPIKVYDAVTSWENPTVRAHNQPPLDVMAVDNLPSLLPAESTQDFAAQLLPHLLDLDDLTKGVWGRAVATFRNHV